MAKFTTSVELHGYPTIADYETLHDEMERRGYKGTIVDSNSQIEYHLADAEYNLIADITTEAALARAKKAAGLTGNSYSILVNIAARRFWIERDKIILCDT